MLFFRREIWREKFRGNFAGFFRTPKINWISEGKRPFYTRFSRFPRCSSPPPEKGEKGRKRAKRPTSRNGGQTPLKPPFVTPPFAAAQIKAQKFRGKFRSVFREKIRSSKEILLAKFTLQTLGVKSLCLNCETKTLPT